MGSISNNTPAPLWLRSPAGNVTQIAVNQVADLVVGNHDISNAQLRPKAPLPVAQAITFTNVGALSLNFAAIAPAVAPPFNLPQDGAAVLAPIPYTITITSNLPTNGTIRNNTPAPLWLRSPAGNVFQVAVNQVADLVVGKHDISNAQLSPTVPLDVAQAIIFTNVGDLDLNFAAIAPAVAPPFNLPQIGAAVLAPIPYTITISSNLPTKGTIKNSTPAPLWLRSPAGNVFQVAVNQMADLVVGKHDISNTQLCPTAPLDVAQAITFTNVGDLDLHFAAIAPAVAPPFNLPQNGAAVLAPIPYTITVSSNLPTKGSIRNNTPAPLWLRSPAGNVFQVGVNQVADLVTGRHDISSAQLRATAPFDVAQAIVFTNVGDLDLNFAAIVPAVAPPFNLPQDGAAVLAPIPYTITIPSGLSTKGSIRNNTPAPLWLRSPAGNVFQVGVNQVADLVVGKHDISYARLYPTGPLDVAQAIVFTNVGDLNLNFTAIAPAVAPPFNIPQDGAAVLAPIPYTITMLSNLSTHGSIRNNTRAPLWLRSPAGNVFQVGVNQVADLAVGKHDISYVQLCPTAPLDVAQAITFTNVGDLDLNFAPIAPAVAPSFNLPQNGAAVLAPIPYIITISSNLFTKGLSLNIFNTRLLFSIRYNTPTPLWLRLPAGNLIRIAVNRWLVWWSANMTYPMHTCARRPLSMWRRLSLSQMLGIWP